MQYKQTYSLIFSLLIPISLFSANEHMIVLFMKFYI